MRFRFRDTAAAVWSGLAIAVGTAAAATPCAAAIHTQGQGARSPVPGAPVGVTAFVDVAVVPMDDERVLPHQTVLIERGRITAVGPANKIQVPKNAVRIDGQGKYLLPGLADMHAHIGLDDSVAAERRLLLWLADGATTIRNMDHLPARKDRKDPDKLDPTFGLRLRARAAAGELLSPRIYTAGPWGPRPYARSILLPAEDASKLRLDSIAAYVTAYKAAGYDFIKVRMESAAVFDSLVVAARRVGLSIEGHAIPDDGTVEPFLAAGVRSIEHLTGYLHKHRASPDSAQIAALAAVTQRAGVWNCPTAAIMENYKSFGNTPQARREFILALQRAGAGLLLGSDGFGKKPIRIHQELGALVRVGLTPYQALLTGTRNVAQYYGTLDETGTVDLGKRADLVLLTGNPVADIKYTEQPAGVMIGGRWLAWEEIQRRLAANVPE